MIMKQQGYLSYSGKRYRIIVAGMPICNDKRTAKEAIAAADLYAVKLEPKMWNGDLDAWVDMPAEVIA